MTAMLLGTKANDQLVRAAGGIVLREDAAGLVEVAIVHRPGRDDWSFPKGKLDPGESFEDCARREVLEETGYLCRLLEFVGFTQYRDRRDRPKVVGYWAMEVVTGEFLVSREVDALRWLMIDDALALLTYERDRDLLVSLRAFLLARSS
jgi:8-oxo-dGTP diphosphatase